MSGISEWMCVGGPKDGQWVVSARGVRSLHVPVLKEPLSLRAPPTDQTPVETLTYAPMDLAASGETVTVWAPAEWSREDVLRRIVRYTTADALRLLLMRYRAPADGEDAR